MTREEYIKTKSMLAGIDDALFGGHLTPEERAKLQALSTALSERLVRPWIPAGWVRKGMMLTLSAVSVFGLVAELYELMWSFPLIAVFSPRVMGENFHAVSRHDRTTLTDSPPSIST
jgi:hypothetical protein